MPRSNGQTSLTATNDHFARRWQDRGSRPVRIANCSGARGDPGFQMRRQGELGDVDFITGDYLAEMNLAENAEMYRSGKHPGFEPTALDGLVESLAVIARKNIKVVINGGSLNPKGLALKCRELVMQKSLNLKVAYVAGDDLYDIVKEEIEAKRTLRKHLDSDNPSVKMVPQATSLLEADIKGIVSANAYLGARAIVKGLELGADIIICGRVADASPVIGAAWYWHSWSDTDYDKLAQALIAGHLIECSAYLTGANYAGFYEVDPDSLIDLPFPIAEIGSDGTCVVCKHENTKGMITVDTVKCQLLYELQGNVYLNSDVKAYLDDVKVEQVGKDRVRMTGVRGAPPPSTTKLAIFYRGGYQSQILLNATGYATAEKWALYEKQLKYGLKQKEVLKDFEVLEFQVIGIPEPNPTSQLRSTTYCRIFAQAVKSETLYNLLQVLSQFGMQHFSGFHLSLDLRTAIPLPYVAFYPGLVAQNELDEEIVFLSSDGSSTEERVSAGHPPHYQALEPRISYETASPTPLSAFGPARKIRLGDICLARSGDKGANLNCGIFVRNAKAWPWLQSFMTKEKMVELIADDWRDDFFLERVEFAGLWAVHFVIYGILGRGVSSSTKLDALGKGFADFIRDRVIDVPEAFLGDNFGSTQRGKL